MNAPNSETTPFGHWALIIGHSRSELRAAILIGAATGLRSMTPPAVVSAAARRGALNLTGTPFSFLSSAVATSAFGLLAIGELIGDKLPMVPSRKTPVAFLGRIGLGALCGGALSAPKGRLLVGLLGGSLGAVLGTVLGYEFRRRLAKALGGVDFPVALLEDAVAVGTTLWIVTESTE
jgi:uncharacterized membrane protein